MKISERSVRIGGMAFNQLYSNIIFYSSFPFVAASDLAQAQFDSLVSSLIFVSISFLLVALLSIRASWSFLNNNKWFISIAMIVSAFLAAFGAAFSISGVADMLPIIVSGACVGIGFAIQSIFWFNVFSKNTVSSSLTEISIAFALSFALSLIFSLMSTKILMLSMILCPFVSCVALLFLSHTSNFTRSYKTERTATKQGRKLELRNMICVFFFGYTVGCMRNYSASHTFGLDSTIIDAILSLSGLVICVIVVILFRVTNANATRFLYRISFVCILMSCVLVSAGRENITPAVTIAFIAMQCFSCVLIARAILTSWALGGSAFRKCITSFGILYGGEFLGVASAIVLVPIVTIMEVCIVLAGLLLVSYIFFFTESDFLLISTKKGETTHSNEMVHTTLQNTNEPDAIFSDPENILITHTETSIDELCDEISAEFGLTPRESEILPSVAQGRTLARIQEELFISTSTVNTHIRHIYAKCGVSNRQELLDFVDDRRKDHQK